MKVVGVVNLNASRAQANLSTIEKFFKRRKYTLLTTNDTSKLTELYKRALDEKPDVFMIGGGDGTIISGIDYAARTGFKGVFGIIPIGTVNNLARNINLPLTVPLALELLSGESVHEVYLGKANDKLFALSAILGVTVHATKYNSVENKRRFKQVSYLFATLQALRNHESFEYTIRTGNRTLTGKSHSVLVVNAKLGRGFTLAPDTSLQKPDLRLVVYTSKSRLLLVAQTLLYIISFGRIKTGIKDLAINSADITCRPEKAVSLDGEIVSKTPLRVKVDKRPVRIACPD